MSTFSSLSVLIVDRAHTIRATSMLFLQAAGHRTMAVDNGDEALAILARGDEHVDLVILATSLEPLNGYDLGPIVKAVHPSTPIAVLVMGYVELEAFEQGTHLGVDGYLQKPFTKVSLIEAVTTTYAMHRVKVIAHEQRLLNETADGVASSVNVARLRSRL